MEVAVIETGDQAPAPGIDDPGPGVGMRHHRGIVADCQQVATGDGQCRRRWVVPVQGSDPGVSDDHVGHRYSPSHSGDSSRRQSLSPTTSRWPHGHQ
ncbi:Hypothetical protein AA314_03971 [Archangium gephyra]|uniref:Uncharacterized protein n=1 Tax=Archangium gephyra TaxID=48 RepID=A0AAC8Q7C8_9BACT|nr:Hypothetical protein AA314_03971 [Archangium gephyra]